MGDSVASANINPRWVRLQLKQNKRKKKISYQWGEKWRLDPFYPGRNLQKQTQMLISPP